MSTNKEIISVYPHPQCKSPRQSWVTQHMRRVWQRNWTEKAAVAVAHRTKFGFKQSHTNGRSTVKPPYRMIFWGRHVDVTWLCGYASKLCMNWVELRKPSPLTLLLSRNHHRYPGRPLCCAPECFENPAQLEIRRVEFLSNGTTPEAKLLEERHHRHWSIGKVPVIEPSPTLIAWQVAFGQSSSLLKVLSFAEIYRTMKQVTLEHKGMFYEAHTM